MKIRAILSLLIIALSGIGCQRYLDKDPDSSLNVPIDSEEKIAELITGAYPQASYFPFLEARTDNVMERDNGIHSQLNEAMFFWEDYDQEDLDTPLNYWNSCYSGIAQVNKALELLASYPKTNRIKALYGEAFLLRAYLHFMLVNIWAEPYAGERSKQDMGIPYLTKPEKNALVDYKRGTVAQVYDQIEEDLKLGISLAEDKYYQKPKFHFNKKAAYAFASRFYLMKAEWDLVIAYSDYVLGSDPKQKLRNWASYEQEYTFNRKNLFRTYTSTEQEANLLLTTTESRIARNLPTEKFGVTTNTMNTIFNSRGIESCDAGSKLRLGMSYLFSSSNSPINNGMYIAKFDELALFGNTSTSPKDLYITNVLFSTDEVFLNRLEAYAMKKQYDLAVNNIKEFMIGKYGRTTVPPCENDTYTAINNTHYDTYSPFYGMTIKQLALIKIILDFRQKEFLHEGLRWFDIRRFYIPITRTSQSGTYTYQPLRKEDPRKLLQIPAEAIKRGLTPNAR